MASGSPKNPTIKDVAKRAGVSFKTVSRVMNRHPSVNPDLRKAVEEAMRALDYRPHQAARALRSRRSYSIALLTGWAARIGGKPAKQKSGDPYFSEFLNELTLGCGLGAQQSGYHLIYEIVPYGERDKIESSIENLVRNLRPDGVIMLPPLCDIPWLLDMLDDHGVRYARLLPGTELHRGLSFVIDDFSAAKELVDLLLDAGHRRIGMIAGPKEHIAANERRKAFETAIAECPSASGTIQQGNFSLTSGREQALALLRSPNPPTAIFAANDIMAAGVHTVASELGIAIPAELSLVGFDDTMIARMMLPPLTTVRQPTFEIAMQATKKLAQSADAGGPPAAELIHLEYSISQRASIAPPPVTRTGAAENRPDSAAS